MTLLIRVSKQVQRKFFQNPFSSESSALRKGPESREILAVVHGHVEVRHNFISEEEENVLFKEDDVKTEKCVLRVRAVAFPKDSPLLGPVHVLDLDKDGYIKPHIDSVKVCERINPASSLLSDIVMRLVPKNKSTDWVDLLLSRRSLYILRDDARFKFTHEILKDEESFFSGQNVPRHRRISVICPNLPV
uniref:AlkB homolog 7 n=1 Tax=Sinocyclocheilus anshuiensis TaxID=1608454 RepID=A0A671P8N7_9TELE